MALAIAVIAWGTLGYHLIEGWGIFDSFYMTIITISTVGYREITNMSDMGRLWTISLIIIGVTTVTTVVAKFSEELADTLLYRRKKMLKRINKLKDHYIICGYGRIGQVIAKELSENGEKFVIIDHDEKLFHNLDGDKILHINANAVSEDVLIQANISQAKGLVSVINSDAENVFLTLMARELNPNLYIVARSVDPATSKRIKKAGANKVLNPYSLSGYRMAQMLIKPKVNEFVDKLRHESYLGMSIEEILVPMASKFTDKTIAGTNFRKEYNILITGIVRANAELIFNPGPEEIIEAGDNLIAIGKQDDIEILKKDIILAL